MAQRGLGDLAVSLNNAARYLETGQRSGVKEAAKYTKKVILVELGKAVGPDLRMSGVGRAGAKLGVGYEKKRTKDPTYEVKARGRAWPIIERGANPHTIWPKGQTFTMKGRRRRGSKALKLGEGKFSAYANHPGSAAKRPFERGWRRAAPQTTRIFRGEVRKAIVKAW